MEGLGEIINVGVRTSGEDYSSHGPRTRSLGSCSLCTVVIFPQSSVQVLYVSPNQPVAQNVTHPTVVSPASISHLLAWPASLWSHSALSVPGLPLHSYITGGWSPAVHLQSEGYPLQNISIISASLWLNHTFLMKSETSSKFALSWVLHQPQGTIWKILKSNSYFFIWLIIIYIHLSMFNLSGFHLSLE